MAGQAPESESQGLGEAPWELRHWRWVHEEGNTCRECERDRGPHRPTTGERWAYATVARTGRWHGTVLSLLRRWPPRLRGRVPVRDEGTSPATSAGPSPRDLRRVAEDREWDLADLTVRGPVQSRPEFEREVAELEQAIDRAWSAYADRLFDDAR